jgi:hypothetical protein
MRPRSVNPTDKWSRNPKTPTSTTEDYLGYKPGTDKMVELMRFFHDYFRDFNPETKTPTSATTTTFPTTSTSTMAATFLYVAKMMASNPKLLEPTFIRMHLSLICHLIHVALHFVGCG